MALRSRLVAAVKAFGSAQSVPQAMTEAAQDVSQMGPTHPFSPGEPVGPYDGYSRTPRSQDFQTSYNVATRPRTHERVSFETLKGLIESYDAAGLCIWHRIDSIRSLDWKLLGAEHFNGEVDDAIRLAMAVLKRPDHKNKFGTWLAKFLYDVLAYDAGTLYRMRNRAGMCVGLKVVDGITIAPLLDYWGDSPDAPAEAYVQYANGLPWNWLTRDDLIYEPFRPRPDSPYGHAPLESIILNANTDLRFQLYFLQRFTEGNIPEAFAAAPESWTPEQIEQFQEYWDSLIYGDQTRKHQIKWMPPGSSITWSNEKDFTDGFSLFLMRKTAAAYHVVPSDLGFTETVNLSSSESQADVQHRVGDLPLINYVEGILTAFLQDDLGLPLTFNFDRGEEQEDQAAQASADGQYIDRGVISPSEIRELRYGLPEPAGQIVPRYIFTTRGGPVPLSALMGVAGKTDPQTGAPDPGTPLPHEAFTGVEGVIPNPPLIQEPLAEQEYGPKAIPPAPPPQPTGIPVATDPNAPAKVAKEGEGAPAGGGPAGGGPAGPATGITSETGIYGDPLIRDEDEPEDQTRSDDGEHTAAVKGELSAFRRFRQARVRKGDWRDFEFRSVPSVQGHNLNDGGRLAVRKAAGEIAVAGLAVQAADTGRVLMLQRSLDPADPAGGTWECPGGHLENGESPLQGAWREWAEETGAIPPPGTQTGTWTSANGIYQGIVWTVDSESSVPVRCGALVPNPDDPDGDSAESIAWWDPSDLPGNPAVRPELLADIDAVMAALGSTDDTCCGGDCCADGCCQGAGGCPCGPGDDVVKASDAGPKAPAWPGWALDGPTVAYWAPKLSATVAAALSRSRLNQLATAYLTANPAPADGQQQNKRDRNAAAAAWLTSQGVTFPLGDIAAGIMSDGYVIGTTSAMALVNDHPVNTGAWKPGVTAGGLIPDYLLAGIPDAGSAAADQMSDGYRSTLGRTLADGADSGLTAAALGAALAAVLADVTLAANLIADQITAASGQAAQAVYTANQVAYGRWITDPGAPKTGPCPICLANEAAGRVRIGEPYPSGDIFPPAHPGCACATGPA